MHTLQRNKRSWATWTLTLVSVLWFSFILVPCVHAVSFDQQTEHNCPHCPSPGKDSCHQDNNCGDCDSAKTKLEKTQKINFEQDDFPKFAALTQDSQIVTTNITVFFETRSSTQLDYRSPPIYLKNCAFLN